MKKIYIGIGIVVIILVLVIVNLKAKPAGKNVEISIAGKGEITSRVESTGELKAKDQVNISAQTIAQINKINNAEGDYVKKGALLIQLDDTQAESNLALADANLKQAEQDLNRGQALFDKKLISPQEFNQVRLAYTTTKTKYDQAHDALLKTRIYAPISGRIIQLNVKEGETVVMGTMNNSGTILMVLADMSTMMAVVDVDETDTPDLKLGQPAEVTADALPDSIFKGKVTKIGLMPVPNLLSTDQATNFEVEIEMKDFSLLLRPGMNVSADVITSEKKDILTIPAQAMGRRMKDKKMSETVFVLKGKKAVLKEIKTGSSSDTDIEILSGIELGDTIITGPYRILSKLKDGESVSFSAIPFDSTKGGSKSSSRPPGRPGMRLHIGG
jgi:HlyD family secretion protein